MSASGGWGTSLGLTLAVFVGGTAIGFSWRQGWLPIEFLPANTGTLNDVATEPEPNSIAPQIPVSPIAFAPNTAPVNEAAPFPGEHSESAVAATVPTTESAHGDRRVQPAAFQDAAPPPTESSSFDETLVKADQLRANGETLAAHKLLSKLYWNHRARRPELQERIDATARLVFFDPQPHFIEAYTIQSGDRLDAIAADYHVSWEYLSALNRTDPRRIQAGRRLKVVRGPFAAVVELDDFSLTVHLSGYYVRRYPVGIGRDGSSPVGKFAVLNKVVNPSYTDPDGRVIEGDDPQNPLGERWIDLGNSYGLHGTIEPESVGRAASRGCVRLRDDDVIAVYNFLVNGSEVVIRK